MHPNTMETLEFFRGDTIIVRGKKRKDTGACFWRAFSYELCS